MRIIFKKLLPSFLCFMMTACSQNNTEIKNPDLFNVDASTDMTPWISGDVITSKIHYDGFTEETTLNLTVGVGKYSSIRIDIEKTEQYFFSIFNNIKVTDLSLDSDEIGNLYIGLKKEKGDIVLPLDTTNDDPDIIQYNYTLEPGCYYVVIKNFTTNVASIKYKFASKAGLPGYILPWVGKELLDATIKTDGLDYSTSSPLVIVPEADVFTKLTIDKEDTYGLYILDYRNQWLFDGGDPELILNTIFISIQNENGQFISGQDNETGDFKTEFPALNGVRSKNNEDNDPNTLWYITFDLSPGVYYISFENQIFWENHGNYKIFTASSVVE